MGMVVRCTMAWGQLTLLKNLLTSCSQERLGLTGKAVGLSYRLTSTTTAVNARVTAHLETVLTNKILPEDSSPGYVRGTDYYHRVMESLPQYQDTVFTRDALKSLICDVVPNAYFLGHRNWNEASATDIINSFRAMTSFAVASEKLSCDPALDPICQVIRNRNAEFSDVELFEFGKLISLWPLCHIGHVRYLCEIFNTECFKRFKEKWFPARNIIKILQFADVLYWQREGNSMGHNFVRDELTNIKIFSISKEPHHIMKIVFYFGAFSVRPQEVASYSFQVFQCREYYSLQELLLFAYSLHSTKCKIEYFPLLGEILRRVLDNFSILDDRSIITISKTFHHATNQKLYPNLRPQLDLVQKRFMARISEFSNNSIVYGLWMFSAHKIAGDYLVQAVYERVINDVSNMSGVNLTRCLRTFSNHISPKRDLKLFGETVYQEIQKPEKMQYLLQSPLLLGDTLLKLLHCGVFPTVLMDDYLTGVHDKNSVPAVNIDIYLDVFYPDYKGNRLSHDIYKAVYEVGSC